MKTITTTLGILAVATLQAVSTRSHAAVITFGDSAGFGMAPWSEAGYVVTATGSLNAIDDPAGTSFSSHYFTYDGPSTTATIAKADSLPFNLGSLDIGRGEYSDDSFTDITIEATVFGGGTLTATYTNVTTVQNVVLNWSNITSFTVSGTDDPGIDNINDDLVSSVPEPGSVAVNGVIASALIGSMTRRKRRSIA
jgi:hypothetical protein